MRDLPDLHQGRYEHGCTSFDNNDGTQVLYLYQLLNLLLTPSLSDSPHSRSHFSLVRAVADGTQPWSSGAPPGVLSNRTLPAQSCVSQLDVLQ